MKLVGLIGYPLAHSITPEIYNAVLWRMGVDARCEAWPTPPEELGAAVQRLRDAGTLGANVTIPHKESIIPLIDELTATAKKIGAVNCVAKQDGRLVGTNTDRYGFMRALEEARFDPFGRKAVVLGAGGSARAVICALIEARAASVLVAGRSQARIDAFTAEIRKAGWGSTRLEARPFGSVAFAKACGEAHLIVNCTPVGTRGSEAASETLVTRDLIAPGAIVFDLVYNPPETPLLVEARAAQAVAISGLDMLIYQGAESLQIWTGEEPPVSEMRAAALRALAQRV